MSYQILIILCSSISHENLSASCEIVMEKMGTGAKILNSILSILGYDVRSITSPELEYL